MDFKDANCSTNPEGKICDYEQSDNISITSPPICSQLICPMVFSMSYTDKYSWIIKLARMLKSCREPFENVPVIVFNLFQRAILLSHL